MSCFRNSLFVIKGLLILFSLGVGFSIQAREKYPLTEELIDVVIVSHPKDKKTLDDCIKGIKENCWRIRRVIVVSSKKLTHQAEWFSEKDFPFTLEEVALEITRGDKKKGQTFIRTKERGPGWYFQQLLKLYSPFIIPDISSNVLVIDADTIFLNTTDFLNTKGGGLFCVDYKDINKNYFLHASRLIPGYRRVYPQFYSICHHMLFQKPILENLFQVVEKGHGGIPFWKAFCRAVDLHYPGASEYEIYFNFALRNSKQVQIRELKWGNSAHLDEMAFFKEAGYHFVSFHTYIRGKLPRTFQ